MAPGSPTQATPSTQQLPTSNPRPIRRFAPEPIETSSKSSKTSRHQSPSHEGSARAGESPAPAPAPAPAPRRFAPALVESSKKSNRAESSDHAGRVKFKPELVETTSRSSKGGKSRVEQSDPKSEPAPRRKFEPILIDTAQRSRRTDGKQRQSDPDYHTEYGHHLHAQEHRRHITGSRTPKSQDTMNCDDVELGGHGEDSQNTPRLNIPPELRRPVSPLDGSPSPRQAALLAKSRSHSFRCPDLDTIESSESERGSGPSSLGSSPGQGSPLTASDVSFPEFYKHATRIRESVDENFTHYLLQLEARKAEQRLQEQALAAFPNSDFHEPVQHYVDNDKDSDDMEIEDRPVTWEGFDEDEVLTRVRRDSTKVPWEQLEMQRHAEKMEKERLADPANASKQAQTNSPWWNPGAGLSIYQGDNEMRSMRDRARPPMLGRDLVFPRCPSPEGARFDVTQRSSVVRSQMESSGDALEEGKSGPPCLWIAPKRDNHGAKALPKSSRSNRTPVEKPATGAAPPKGLWGGFCVDDGETKTTSLAPPSVPTGLMTPRVDDGAGSNPFEQSFAAREAGDASVTPPTPPESVSGYHDLGGIDNVLVTDHELDQVMAREFPETFITQVYNYLSLGYPSLARPFDEELSKISRIPIATLREDDARARNSPRGYIRLGDDFEGLPAPTPSAEDEHSGAEQERPEYSCMRWQALKLYVREWARQEKNMVSQDNSRSNWGTGARRGSWAI